MGISATERKTKQQHKRQTARRKPAVCLFFCVKQKSCRICGSQAALFSVEKQLGFVDGADAGVQGEKAAKRKRYEQSGFLAV